jgi:hypothetical protein
MRNTKAVLGGIAAVVLLMSSFASADPRVIEITSTKDAKFKIAGQKEPVITAKPGEVLKLKFKSEKGPEFAKDGRVHSFSIKELKDQGWDIQLKEGTQEAVVSAPEKPGEYLIECLVKCGPGHEKMTAKLIVK